MPHLHAWNGFHHRPVSLNVPCCTNLITGQHAFSYAPGMPSLATRACLDQHLIAIRSAGIRGNHLRLDTSLIAITRGSLARLSRLRSQSSAVQTRTDRAMADIWSMLHGTWQRALEISQRQQPVKCCGGDKGVPGSIIVVVSITADRDHWSPSAVMVSRSSITLLGDWGKPYEQRSYYYAPTSTLMPIFIKSENVRV